MKSRVELLFKSKIRYITAVIQEIKGKIERRSENSILNEDLEALGVLEAKVKELIPSKRKNETRI